MPAQKKVLDNLVVEAKARIEELGGNPLLVRKHLLVWT